MGFLFKKDKKWIWKNGVLLLPTPLTVNSDKDLFREETKHYNHYFMSSFLVKDEPMRKEDYSQKVLDLFLPVNKLTKTKEGYRWMGQYKNLSRYEFSKEEIEFLSDCYFSGKHSLIGVTNADGLTIQAISDRYQISKDLVESWMWSSKEQRILIKEMMDCVNGMI